MASSLFATYNTGAALPTKEIHITGLYESLHRVWQCQETNPCRRCWNFAKYLPIADLVIALARPVVPVQALCLNKDDFWQVLMRRRGTIDVLKRVSEYVLCRVVRASSDFPSSGNWK